MRTRLGFVLAVCLLCHAQAKLDTDEDPEDTGEQNLDSGDINKNKTQLPEQDNDKANFRDEDDSSENIGAAVTQIYRHPYAAALLNNGTYVCSAIVLNKYWLITLSKCFDPNTISSYVTHSNLSSYSVRVGSSYNNKGGSIYNVNVLINNFDMKVSAMKLSQELEFGSRVRSVHLPSPDEEVTLGYLATMIAWTPVGHMRIVNAPVMEASICESFSKMVPGHYICVGSVQDPNRHFCRKDNGGAIIQNNTLIGISAFLHTCALYSRTHAFPKVSSFSRWLDSLIWDENNRPSTVHMTTSAQSTQATPNATEIVAETRSYFQDPRKFMLTLPFDPINVPLEPAEDNSVIPRMSLYESYLQNLARAKTSTTMDPFDVEDQKREWLKRFGKAVMNLPPAFVAKRNDPLMYG